MLAERHKKFHALHQQAEQGEHRHGQQHEDDVLHDRCPHRIPGARFGRTNPTIGTNFHPAAVRYAILTPPAPILTPP